MFLLLFHMFLQYADFVQFKSQKLVIIIQGKLLLISYS